MKRKEADRLAWLEKGQSRVLFIACMPKSGSSFLREALLQITGFPRGYARQRYDGLYFFEYNEHDIFEEELVLLYRMGVVIQQHTKGTLHNYRTLAKYGIRPVVLYRSLFDVVVSLKDHLERDAKHFPMTFFHDGYYRLSDEEKYTFIIRMSLPWYFSFLASWIEASRHLDLLEINYEEMVEDRVGTLSKVLQHVGIQLDLDHVAGCLAEVDPKKSRMNVGLPGRGRTLSEANQREIIELASLWRFPPEYLARIGINTERIRSMTEFQ